MEEAEICCQKIGIMVNGSLKCIGQQQLLKEKFGAGFKLYFNADTCRIREARHFMESILPKGWKRLDSFSTNMTYEFPLSSKSFVPRLFELIERDKNEHGILDWGLSQTSLEEVFVKIIALAEAELVDND
jgi:ABC-type multidrug transport system ATPase subunit